MQRGPKPKPVELKRRQGNAGKRRLPDPLPALAQPAQLELERPSLPPAAAALWDEVVPVLQAAGILNRVDRAALTALCLQWERGVAARKVLEQEGYFALGSMGQIVEHPAVSIERQAHQMFLRFAAEYGITASARARWQAWAAAAKNGHENELADVIDLSSAEEVDVA